MTTKTIRKLGKKRGVNNKILSPISFTPNKLQRGSLLWKSKLSRGIKLTLMLVGLPLFLVLFAYTAIVGFSLFLPELNMEVGDRTDRTVRNSLGNYESTFLKTRKETKGAYELIRVEVEPNGGNGWHYHKTMEEHFKVLKGELQVRLQGKSVILKEGETAIAPKTVPHYFHNATDRNVTLLVKVTPAKGLEKSIRVMYGLINTGQWGKNGLPHNLWHLVLILGYSETYMASIPGFIQEPLVNALARIAQWKGEDKALEVFFK
jgi:mannose-6-phosphate isomerase-like protein (cupin superfamily)